MIIAYHILARSQGGNVGGRAKPRGILFIQTPDPLTAQVLAHRFDATIMGTVHNLQLALDDVPVQDVQFQSRR